MRRMLRDQRGFTLTELLVVTAVAERSSRVMRSSATRAFCWVSTRVEPMI